MIARHFRKNHSRRRGTTYVLVLGVAMIVMLLGMSGLVASRLALREAAESQDWCEAGELAISGVEWGLLRLNMDANWRTTFTNNTEVSTPFGAGTMSFKLVDDALGMSAGDGSLSNNSYDPVRVHGIGRVGNAVRVFSVQLIGKNPSDVLRTTVAAKGYLNVSVLTSSTGGPLSTNGVFTRGATVNGNVEAASTSGSGTINGTLTAPATAKTMPNPTVFDAYQRMATTIPWASLSGGQLTGALLSSTSNPTGGATNANGIYYVSVPVNSPFRIRTSHIKGTLVVDCQSGAYVDVTGTTFWEPHNKRYPILLVRHQTTNTARDILQPTSGTITEGANNYPAQLQGLIHVLGATGAASGAQETRMGRTGATAGVRFNGTVVLDTDGAVNTQEGAFMWDLNLYNNPPIGYSTGPDMEFLPGTARWEASP